MVATSAKPGGILRQDMDSTILAFVRSKSAFGYAQCKAS